MTPGCPLGPPGPGGPARPSCPETPCHQRRTRGKNDISDCLELLTVNVIVCGERTYSRSSFSIRASASRATGHTLKKNDRVNAHITADILRLPLKKKMCCRTYLGSRCTGSTRVSRLTGGSLRSCWARGSALTRGTLSGESVRRSQIKVPSLDDWLATLGSIGVLLTLPPAAPSPPGKPRAPGPP